MSKGKCKLCLLDGMDLQESHFLSAGIYRLLRGDGEANPNPWVIMEKAAFQTSKQQKAPLLCSDCEQRLSRNGENWALRNCLKADRSFPLAATLASQSPDLSSAQTTTKVYYASGISAIDVDALSYFAASIFWRGSIYPWNRDGSYPVNLGPFQEPFRTYLMGLAPFPKDSSLWVIVREGGQIDRMTYAPLGKREGKVHVYKFPMPGLGFSLTVSKNVPTNYRNLCFVHGNGNPIIATTILEDMLMRDAVRLGEKSLRKCASMLI
ncbi:MAG TPA: hypothetical protein VLY23_06125 [Candidatus Acidoferrum sp.]|nr:hypothetical protein [Candidatus Acidoferrum sp.]